MNLSIIIPSQENLIQKDFYTIYGGGKVYADRQIFQTWQTAIYEVWNGDQIYEDLLDRIKQLTAEIGCAENCGDFSQYTQNELEAEKSRIVEGVKTLQRINYDMRSTLVHDLEILLDTAERYVNKRLRIEKTMELVEQLENRIRQFIADSEVGYTDLVEYNNIKTEIIFLKKFGANKEELKRLRHLEKTARQFL